MSAYSALSPVLRISILILSLMTLCLFLLPPQHCRFRVTLLITSPLHLCEIYRQVLAEMRIKAGEEGGKKNQNWKGISFLTSKSAFRKRTKGLGTYIDVIVVNFQPVLSRLDHLWSIASDRLRSDGNNTILMVLSPAWAVYVLSSAQNRKHGPQVDLFLTIAVLEGKCWCVWEKGKMAIGEVFIPPKRNKWRYGECKNSKLSSSVPSESDSWRFRYVIGTSRCSGAREAASHPSIHWYHDSSAISPSLRVLHGQL